MSKQHGFLDYDYDYDNRFAAASLTTVLSRLVQ